eukprot:CAMPEP_0177690826 /NCGR_PEP_ID=MMETSP0484_2-20121128/975_1 /TAXON_ID=354590 /ORGANISM="Rhodomonas lens, Strain RHODO" /LENGTH=99 /DNA_ID=CAMNT_0019201399 /DNA_START=913 /DNA_END=1212 /DNA_ORIENTATION=+
MPSISALFLMLFKLVTGDIFSITVSGLCPCSDSSRYTAHEHLAGSMRTAELEARSDAMSAASALYGLTLTLSACRCDLTSAEILLSSTYQDTADSVTSA